MYQLAEPRRPDVAHLFLESCTGLLPTHENLALVRTAASLVRSALTGAGTRPLHDFVRAARRSATTLNDVLSAAGQVVIDEAGSDNFSQLSDLVHRVAQIERDALATLRRRSRSRMKHACAA